MCPAKTNDDLWNRGYKMDNLQGGKSGKAEKWDS
jgi:hypothetical protein